MRGAHFTDLMIERLVRGLTATDAPPFDAGRVAIDAHLHRLLDELRGVDGIDLVVERASYLSGDASFIEAFAWPADGSSMRRPPQSLARTLRSGTPVLIDGVTLLVSRLAPACCLAPRTMPRLDDQLRFELPIGLATDAWIQQDLGPLAAFAAAVRDGLACLGLTVCAAEELLRPIAFQGPLDGHGSLMNIGGPNRVFDALFRWCD